MPAHLSRLRRWFALAIVAAVLLVAGAYFYTRHRVQNALKQIPGKIGLEIKQSVTGFSVSKSEQGRTLFTVQASKAVQFKQGGRAELHDVQITLYGSDSSRFDRIRGTDFEYDQQTGDVTAKGEVQIDMQANPQGLLNPDQAPPKDLKNPVHLATSGLVFNQKTGDAHTRERVDFSLPEGSGSAVGVDYVAKTGAFILQSQVNVALNGAATGLLTAVRATVTKDPRVIVLDHPHVVSDARQCDADQATLFLRPDNTLERVLAHGNVLARTGSPQTPGSSQSTEISSRQLELTMAKQQHSLRSAIFSGSVRAQAMEEGRPGPGQASPSRPMQASAGRVTLEFAPERRSGKGSSSSILLTRVHADDSVKLLQHQNAVSQDVELNASGVDFLIAKGGRPERAETSGAAQIVIRPSAAGGPQTVVTAAKFDAAFDHSGRFTSVHGAPDARIVSQNPGQPDRVSASQALDATFQPGGGIQSLVQQGNVVYVDGERKAWGARARYTPGDQMLILSGSSRVADGGMTTTADTMRMNRASGDAFAEGNVKTTYSDLKPQPGGALLSSSSPIHVTARSMTVHGTSSIALYAGDARLWQDANVIEAQSIEFNRDQRSMVALGSATPGTGLTVSTILNQSDGPDQNLTGKSASIAITSNRLTYADNERKAHFEGEVIAKAADVTISAKKMDAFLRARGSNGQPASSAGKLDKIVAAEQVVIAQPDRHATGDLLTYTAMDDKFVLTGESPSIFDAEHGKITGVSLTFFRRDDRVLVEGNNLSPTVTQTRVAR